MSLFYRIAYRLGFTPWEAAATHPVAARHIESLFDREEQDRARPLGRALDVGCGRGHWAVVLSRRGWDVTGVDLETRAIDAARERARTEGVNARFLVGDVTRLSELDISRDFDFAWDFGTLHGLTPRQLRLAAAELGKVSRSGAHLLMLAWKPGKRGPLPRGLDRAEIEEAFEVWRIDKAEPFDATGLPAPLRKVEPVFYRLIKM